ncbi:MAG: C39 family peptidase [Bacteroidota bacterium]|nr:C39 family peptidase [Bacteroidota bacterium]MDP4230579.1 C39 family peptidase [Bacteroidota bacterium]MDP4237833.1 C39 family peptidase [Bacteroidota bacterium]
MPRKIRRSLRSGITGASLFLSGILLLSGFLKTHAAPGSLHVPFIPQVATNWCWAATTAMVLAYEHRSNPHVRALTQCQYVQAWCKKYPDYAVRLWMLDSCPPSDSGIYYYNFPSTPFVEALGHTMQERDRVGLTYEELCSEISAGRPVIFQWKWQGITPLTKGRADWHYLLAEGCPESKYINSPGWVSVHDPWPVNRGKHRIMSYSEYDNLVPTSLPGSREFVYTTHGSDYYGITFKGN